MSDQATSISERIDSLIDAARTRQLVAGEDRVHVRAADSALAECRKALVSAICEAIAIEAPK